MSTSSRKKVTLPVCGKYRHILQQETERKEVIYSYDSHMTVRCRPAWSVKSCDFLLQHQQFSWRPEKVLSRVNVDKPS